MRQESLSAYSLTLSSLALSLDYSTRSERFVIAPHSDIFICRDTMPTPKELQQNRLKTNSTKRRYDAHTKKFVGWYQEHIGDYTRRRTARSPSSSSPPRASGP